MNSRTHHWLATFTVSAIALVVSPAVSQPASPAAAAKSSTLLKAPTPGLATPIGPLLAPPRVVTKSVSFEGSTSDPTGITACVENTGGTLAKGVKIGMAFRYADVMNGVRRTNDHFLGAFVDNDIAPKTVVCRTYNLAGGTWQPEFRNCNTIDARGGIRDAGNTAFTNSITIQPTCGKIRVNDTFPRGVASAPILKPPSFDIPVVPLPKPPVLPPPPSK